MLEVDLPQPRSPEPVARQVDDMGIIYVDDDLVVVDKPAGIAAHPSMGWDGPDVLGALKACNISVTTSGAAERQGIVSRLDVGTSGVMVVARSEYAYSSLKQQFREHSVDKIYHTLVQGHPDPTTGTIDAPIGRHPSREWKMAIIEGGRASRTHYDMIEAMPRASLLEIHLETGRTHQIRVHMSAVGHPCVGDETYGADPQLSQETGLKRQWLHAVELSLTHPATAQRVTFTSQYSADLAHALEVVRL
jgi:pseudouridine synthase, rluA family